MKKLRLLIIVILSAVILLPYMLGFEIKSRYRGLLSQFEESGYQLASHEYDQGFYHSQARSVLALPVYTPEGKQADIRIKVVSDITHGPYTLEQGWIGDLTRFTTNFFHADKALFPAEYQDQVTTTMAFNGDGKTSIDLPALTAPITFENNISLDFKGLQGQVDFNVIEGKVLAEATAEGLTFSSPGQGRLQLGKVILKSDSSRGIADLMLGKGEFTIDAVSMNDFKRDLNVQVSDIAISADAYEQNETVNMTAEYAVQSLVMNREHYGPAVIELELHSIAAEAMGRIQENLREMQQQHIPPEQQGMAMMGVFMSVLPALLERNPGFSLKKMEINTPDGKVLANLSLTADSMSIADISVADNMLKKLVGEASLQIPEKLLKKMMMSASRQEIYAQLLQQKKDTGEMPDISQVEQLVEQMATAQLDGLLAQGLLERKADDIVSVASLKEGHFSVNGQVLSLPGAQ